MITSSSLRAVTFEDKPALDVKCIASRDAGMISLREGTQQQVWVASGSATERLVWDVVENAFVLEETGQTLQELLGEAVSERVGEDVSF